MLDNKGIMDAMTVLVSLEQSGETVGILRGSDGRMWLSGSIERVAGPELDDRRAAWLGLDANRTLVGGRLPPGAVSAEVVDDTGECHVAATENGAYVAILDEPSRGQRYPVCCRGADGAPVAPTLPLGWTRTAVSDAAETCPACGALAWDEVRPTDDSRGARGTPDGGFEPTPRVVCRTCGHEESVGAWARMAWIPFQGPGPAQPAMVTRAIRARLQARRRSKRELLSRPMTSTPTLSTSRPSRIPSRSCSAACRISSLNAGE